MKKLLWIFLWVFFGVHAVNAQAPVNDVCSSATLIAVNGGAIAANNSNTVTNGANPSCGGTTGIKDIWYKFVYTGGTVVVETQLGTNTDTRLAVYTACGGTQLACNDDYGGTYRSYISLSCTQLIAGNTYYIQAGGYNAVVGSFTLILSATGIQGCTDPQATNYSACATTNNGTCTYPVLTAQFTNSPTGTNCLNVQFTSTSSGNITGYNWSFPGGSPSSSTSQNPVVTYPAAGTYSATLTITDATGATSTATSNNVVVTTGDIVTVDITADANPSQTSWKMFTENNTLVAQGTTNDATFCINSSCHRFEIYDSGGNGLSGAGNYKIYLNGILEAQGASFAGLDIRYVNCPQGKSCNDPIPSVLGVNDVPFDNTYFVFTPSVNGQYRISTCGYATCDTRIWIYDYCVMANFDNSNEATYTYNDDFCGVQAQTDVFMTAGSTYYVRIGSSGSCAGSSYQAMFEYVGPITGCMDVLACNYQPLASVSGPCYYNGDANCTGLGPDLLVDQASMFSSLTSTTLTSSDACLVNEGCLQSNVGTRQILRFTTRIANIGTQDYFIGAPNASNPQFTFDPCHNHYHYAGYAEYLLYDANGTLMPDIGFKNGFCVLDLSCPAGISAQYSCGNMGITAGCADIYSSSLTCQWIDVTNVPAGTYYLLIRTNWDQSPDANGRYELRYDNNYAQVCISFGRDANNNIINFTKSITSCPAIEDCLGIPFGDNNADCAGNCPGVVLQGDVNNDGYLTAADEHAYGEAALNGGVSVSNCTDLNDDGEITVADASYLGACIHAQQDLGVPPLAYEPCGWDPEMFDNENIVLGVTNLNTTNSTFDIYINNPQNEIWALQFDISGAVIQSVQNLLPSATWNAHLHNDANSIAVTSELHTQIPTNETNLSILRVQYSSLTGSSVCISNIVDALNDFNHNVLASIGECVYTAPPVNASFTASQTAICSGQTIQFSSTSTGSPSSFSWSFPGGTPSTSSNPSVAVTYATAGNYNVTLSVSNGTSSDTETMTNLISVGSNVIWYLDADNDGFGNAAITQSSCNQPSGYVANAQDCNDSSPNIKPGTQELCNNIDDNCSGGIDEGYDNDNDGFTTCEQDCNDNNALIHPGAFEICDGLDNNCDNITDEGYDADEDGYTVCNGDCDDGDDAVNPGASELCNAGDDDCDGNIDEGFDTDNDGYTSCNGDCNDNNAAIKPGATEICDGIDNNCSNGIDEGFDLDNDGFTTCGGDCNDNNASINPAAAEICNGIDDNCAGGIDNGLSFVTYYIDTDNDGYGNNQISVSACSQPSGYVTTGGDCNDNNNAVRPNVAEICGNNVDENCNGQISEGCCNLSASATATNASCQAAANGTATVTTAGGTAPFSYLWSNGATTASISNLQIGQYTVTVTDTFGCTATATVTVGNNLQSAPAAPTAISGPAGVCRNTTGQIFSVTPVQNATSYVWTLPSGATGSSTSNSISVSFSGTYVTGNICVQAVGLCGNSATFCRSVVAYTVNPGIPGIINGPSSSVCAGTTQTYSTTAGANATSHIWTAPANSTIISGQGTTTVQIAFASNFGTSGTVSVRAENCFGASSNRTLTVYRVPATPGTVSGSASNVCPGSTQTYSVATVPGATGYTWTLPNSMTLLNGQGTNTINVQISNNFNSGTISVAATSACGSSAQRTLSVSKAPLITGTIQGQQYNLCGGGTFTYSIAAVTGAVSYNWVIPNGCTLVTNSGTSVTITVPSNFNSGTISVTATNSCGATASKSLSITKLPQPPSSITGPSSVCSGQQGVQFSTPANASYTYSWSKPNSVTLVAGQGTANVTMNWGSSSGSVSVKSVNACGSSTAFSKSVTVTTCMEEIKPSMDDAAESDRLEVYPNPTSGHFSIVGGTSGNYALFNSLGQLVTEVRLNAENNFSITMDGLEPGVYLLRSSDKAEHEIKRIVVTSR
jgi:PKD repeat protein